MAYLLTKILSLENKDHVVYLLLHLCPSSRLAEAISKKIAPTIKTDLQLASRTVVSRAIFADCRPALDKGRYDVQLKVKLFSA